MVMEFRGDDGSYLNWIEQNRTGYVLNTRSSPDPSYMVLHRASCRTIASTRRKSGAYTERGYKKVCATSIAELRRWVRTNGRNDGSFSKECNLCNPQEWSLQIEGFGNMREPHRG